MIGMDFSPVKFREARRFLFNKRLHRRVKACLECIRESRLVVINRVALLEVPTRSPSATLCFICPQRHLHDDPLVFLCCVPLSAPNPCFRVNKYIPGT